MNREILVVTGGRKPVVLEKTPTQQVVAEYFFETDADAITFGNFASVLRGEGMNLTICNSNNGFIRTFEVRDGALERVTTVYGGHGN